MPGLQALTRPLQEEVPAFKGDRRPLPAAASSHVPSRLSRRGALCFSRLGFRGAPPTARAEPSYRPLLPLWRGSQERRVNYKSAAPAPRPAHCRFPPSHAHARPPEPSCAQALCVRAVGEGPGNWLRWPQQAHIPRNASLLGSFPHRGEGGRTPVTPDHGDTSQMSFSLTKCYLVRISLKPE